MSCVHCSDQNTGLFTWTAYAAVVGAVTSDDTELRMKRGIDIDKGDISFIVRIERDGETECAGVLVGKRTVLTSNKCVKPSSLESYTIVLTAKGCDSTKCEERRQPVDLWPQDGDEDVILVRFGRKINKKKYKTMKRLSEERDQNKLTECRVIGFSDNKRFREAAIKILPAKKCSVEDKDKTLCLDVGNAAVCSENRGSPVLCNYDDRWHVAGLLNAGEKCQKGRIQAVRLSYFKVEILQALYTWSGKEPNWDILKVTLSVDPASSFQSVPRTQREAKSDGWVPFTPGAKCDDNPKFKGVRYIKDNDMGVIPIYDQSGYIAGIQIGFPETYSPNPNNYPYPALKNTQVILDQGNYFLTAYFTNPAKICEGRTALDFVRDGTGTKLLIQSGLNPASDYLSIPLTQTAADKTLWTQSPCFPNMGTHYWYDLRKDMDCEDAYAFFLLYDNGQLNGFGWALQIDIKGVSDRIENPPPAIYEFFMDPVPDCLSDRGTMTTLHIYLKDNPVDIKC